jgi:hypothetical protein
MSKPCWKKDLRLLIRKLFCIRYSSTPGFCTTCYLRTREENFRHIVEFDNFKVPVIFEDKHKSSGSRLWAKKTGLVNFELSQFDKKICAKYEIQGGNSIIFNFQKYPNEVDLFMQIKFLLLISGGRVGKI